jgi:hypothetical protein
VKRGPGRPRLVPPETEWHPPSSPSTGSTNETGWVREGTGRGRVLPHQLAHRFLEPAKGLDVVSGDLAVPVL